MLRRLRAKANIFNVTGIVAGLLIVIPLLTILLRLFESPTDTWVHIRTHRLRDYIENTVVLIGFVAVLSASLGYFAAHVVTRYEFKGRKTLQWMLILPLAIPSYIMGYVYADMFSYIGIVPRNLREIGIDLNLAVMSMRGAVVIFTLTLYPYVYMLTRSALSRQHAAFTESARLLGASTWRTFWRVVLPLARPALVAGTVLVVLETLNDYGLVAYFNVQVFSFAIFNAWFSFHDIASAIRLSAVLMVIVFVVVVLERVLRGRRRYDQSSRPRPLPKRRLKGVEKLYPATLWAILATGFFIPVAHLVWLSRFSRVGFFSLETVHVTLNTLTISVAATLIIVFIAVLLANFGRGRKTRSKTAWLKLTNLGYAIPGAVLAVAVHVFFVRLDRTLYPLYRLFNPETGRLVLSLTLAMLLFAYVLRFMAIGFNTIEASYDKLGESYTEAAYTLKSGKLKTLMTIDVPLIKTGLIGAAIIVFIDVIKELPLTLILRPANYNTMASRVYEYASEERLAEAAVPSLILIAVAAVCVYVLTHLKSKEVIARVRKN